MILSLKSSFSSAHFYSQPEWSEAKNKEIFGRCHTPYGHGHNYVLEVGFHLHATDLPRQKDSYKKLLTKLTDALDHAHLNFVIPEFKKKNPTTENIALYFLEKLKNATPRGSIAYIRLYEMDNLWTEIRL